MFLKNNKYKKYIWIILTIIFSIFIIDKLFAKIILISFDGSGYFDMWEQTMLFAKDHEDDNMKFTYFISAPYFVTEKECRDNPYWALNELSKPMYCKIQEDKYIESVIRRREYVKYAIKEGHEIGSHLCGHYDGKNWTYEQWDKEMKWFRWVMEKSGIDNKNIVGIRTPYLSTNINYYKALEEDKGYLYDSSKGYNKKVGYTADVEIPIKSMGIIDYTKQYMSEVMDKEGNVAPVGYTLPFDDAFQTWFDKNKYYKKIDNEKIEFIYFKSLCYKYLDINDYYPLQICLHFEQINNGAYYNAMVKFVDWVSDKDPTYMTYKDYYDYIKENKEAE
jgi:peptidoglycan/xylan/chitin deacetylase (PgdA/CDA1 family)